MKEARIVDDIVVNMIDVGEETGELDTMLNKIADNYDEEVETAVESLVSLLEPIMIVILGGIIGFIVIALFLPLDHSDLEAVRLVPDSCRGQLSVACRCRFAGVGGSGWLSREHSDNRSHRSIRSETIANALY